MIELTFREIVGQFTPPEVKQSAINDAVRRALIDCAEYLIQVNLRQMKFNGRNRSRYNFTPRNPKYERRKRFAKLVRDPETGLKVQPDRPALDLRYTGRLRRFIEGRGPEQYRKIVTATSNRIRLRVPIQVPHRMRSEQFEELGRWSADEYAAMSKYLTARVAHELGWGAQYGEQLWRGAA